MIARLLRDALGRVPPQDRSASLDEDIRAWADRLARLSASTQRDPYLRRAPEILAAGAGLASRTREAPGYSEVAAALLGLLAGLQAPARAAAALVQARASLDTYRMALDAAEAAGMADETDRLELRNFETAYRRIAIAAHDVPLLTTAGVPGG